VFGEEPRPARPSAYARPTFEPDSRVYQDHSWWQTAARRSAVLVASAALVFAWLPGGGAAQPAPRAPVRAALGWDVLAVNGDRDGSVVVFDHLAHQERAAQAATGSPELAGPGGAGIDGCTACHHLSQPGDEVTPCWECHRDMTSSTSIFDHSLHQAALGGNAACVQCHAGEHLAATAKPCQACHATMKPGPGETAFDDRAIGYAAAMHGACIPCHQQEAAAQARPELARCPACHQSSDGNAVDLTMALTR
jgi:hypothetical protein